MQQRLDRFDESFAQLQRDVAGEPVADDDVRFTGVDVAPFDVADEGDRRGLQELMRFARQLVPLGLFFTDRQQPDAWGVESERDARVRRSHDGELDEVRRTAADGRAGVEEHGRRAARGDDGGERGTVDPREQPEGRVCGHDGGAGVAGAEQRVRGAVAHRLGGDLDGGARLAPQGLRGAFRHLDAIGRVDDLDVDTAEHSGHRVAGQLVLYGRGVPHEEKPDLEVTRRDERPIDDNGRPGVAAHGVDRDTHVSCQLPVASFQCLCCELEAGNWKLLFHRLDLASAVVAAGGAHLVRELRFVALRTLAAADRLQGIVRAALRGPGLRVPAFWIRHDVPDLLLSLRSVGPL